MRLARLSAVEVAYPGRGAALGPFDLEVEAGEAIALVGPSGCGKSTALRLMAGLESPTRGQAALAASKGETSVVFQSPTLAPWLSALDNVALPLDLAGAPRLEARARSRAALERVGLGDAWSARPAQLSGGMAMRAALARALVTRPRLLLLDEPFAALDEITRRRLADDLLTIWAETGAAMVFVTHNVEEAVYVAERIVVMTPGPGRVAGEIRAEAAPHGSAYRLGAAFRTAVEAVSECLSRAMPR